MTSFYYMKGASSGTYARFRASLLDHPNHLYGNQEELLTLLRSGCCALPTVFIGLKLNIYFIYRPLIMGVT